LATEWNPHVSHLIADTFRRTTKMMCAICHGAQIIVPDFIVKCRQVGALVDSKEYALRDSVCETAFARKRGLQNYSLCDALERRRINGPLLKGISVHCLPSVVERRELPLLISSAGGTWLKRFPASPDDSNILLLGEQAQCTDKEVQRRKSHKVYDVELVREAACTQILRRSAYQLR